MMTSFTLDKKAIMPYLRAEGIVETVDWTHDCKDHRRDADDPAFVAHTAAMSASVSAEFKKRLHEVIIAMTGLSALEAIRLMTDVRHREWVANLTDVLRREIGSAVGTRGEQELRRVLRLARPDGLIGISFNLQNRRVQRFINNESRIIGKEATDAFRTQIRDALRAGVDAGESSQQIANRIRAIDDRFIPSRSMMIARTETAFAFTAGTIEGWDQSGVVSGKRWNLAPNACPFCTAAAAQFEGVTVGLREAFFNHGDSVIANDDGQVREMKLDYDGYRDSGLQGPPLHPHCRCSILPVLIEG